MKTNMIKLVLSGMVGITTCLGFYGLIHLQHQKMNAYLLSAENNDTIQTEQNTVEPIRTISYEQFRKSYYRHTVVYYAKH
jgi:hypothetical protein